MKVFNLYPKCNVAGSGDLLNTCTFQFNAPRHTKQDTYISKVDYVADAAGKHQISVRGTLQNDHSDGTPQFPGQMPSSVTLSNNKGLAAGYTWVMRPNMVNSFKYGLTRQGGESTGLQNSPVTTFRGYDNIYATGTNTKRIVPVHTISDDFSWIKSGHDLRFGGYDSRHLEPDEPQQHVPQRDHERIRSGGERRRALPEHPRRASER